MNFVNSDTCRQWEGGLAMACSLLLLALFGAGCVLYMMLQNEEFTFSVLLHLLLPLAAVIDLAYFTVKFYHMWNTCFSFSQHGIVMTRYKKVLQEFAREQVKIIYMRPASGIPAQNNIIFAKGEIERPFGRRWRSFQKAEPNFLFWMSYTKEKEAVIKKFAESKIRPS